MGWLYFKLGQTTCNWQVSIFGSHSPKGLTLFNPITCAAVTSQVEQGQLFDCTSRIDFQERFAELLWFGAIFPSEYDHPLTEAALQIILGTADCSDPCTCAHMFNRKAVSNDATHSLSEMLYVFLSIRPGMTSSTWTGAGLEVERDRKNSLMLWCSNVCTFQFSVTNWHHFHTNYNYFVLKDRMRKKSTCWKQNKWFGHQTINFIQGRKQAYCKL